MPQFYLPGPLECQKPTNLTPEASHHLRVRRVQVGAFVPVFDGKGQIANGGAPFFQRNNGSSSSIRYPHRHPPRDPRRHHAGPRTCRRRQNGLDCRKSR
ncbi:RNA methyltransferase PUA domain-containing protein [Polynucleobacter necessarius]|uniref:RNA methyltransferase PUA domain-containing protein n=1 Tax=Polynucleobacter necessarius TaxID=576610 RepID=UPI002F94D360